MNYNYWRCIKCGRSFRTRGFAPNHHPSCPFCDSKKLAFATAAEFKKDRGLR